MEVIVSARRTSSMDVLFRKALAPMAVMAYGASDESATGMDRSMMVPVPTVETPVTVRFVPDAVHFRTHAVPPSGGLVSVSSFVEPEPS